MPRTLMGVVHLGALPSASHGEARAGGFERVLASALVDAERLAAAGFDAIMVENFGDAPFHKGTAADPVPPDVVACLAVTARAIAERTGLPVGVNCLRNDGVAAAGVATACGARWMRVNVLTGAYVTDQGLIDGEAARIDRYRRRVAPDVCLLADLFVKHAVALAAPPLAVAARDLASRSGADGLIVTGARTGEAVSASLLREVRDAIPGFPVWIGSGLDPAGAAELWPLCDGAIVGTYTKYDGRTEASVDPARAATIRAACPR
jgi:membrane complex biogenesis BtpA family protein